MIKAIQLGNKQFPVNIIQGPLAGVSCAPFRRLIWKYSQPAYTCTEMISCKTLLHQPLLTQQRFIAKDPAEGPLCFQLSANNSQELAEATKRVTDLGADLIDLNCGCPVKKIRSKGAGSRLLTDSQKLFKLITAMKQNTHLPVSIKIRVEGNSDEKFNAEIAKVVTDAGLDFLVVHGRHWTEHYEIPCNHQQIQFFVETLKIPVIGNGDIRCLDSLQKMYDTGCAGVMIGRSSVGQPWLIAKLTAASKQQQFKIPSQIEIGDDFIEHVLALVSLVQNEQLALFQARKFAKYYARSLLHCKEFCSAVNECDNLDKLTQLTRMYFDEPAI